MTSAQAPHTCEYLVLQCSGNSDCCPKSKDRLITDDGCICTSHSSANGDAVLEQCETCYFKGTRACHYHGYPDDVIEKSCRYKVGIDAQFALNNLAGTFIIKNLRQQTKEREQV